MANPTKTFTTMKDATTASASFGAGRDPHMFVGSEASGTRNRMTYLAPSGFARPADYVSLVSLQLKIRGYSGAVAGHDTPDSNSPHFYVERVLANWAEGTTGHGSYNSNGGGITWANDPAVTTSGRVNAVFNDGAWMTVDCTEIGAYWLAHPTSVFGVRLSAVLDGTDMLFYSRETTSDPYWVLTYVSNRAPNVPVLTAPLPDSFTNTTLGTDLIVAGNFTDPDAADVLGAVQVQILQDAATDAAPGLAAVDMTVLRATLGSAVLTDHAWSVPLDTPLFHNHVYRVRARVQDNRGLWSAWSSVTDARFTTNAVPQSPQNPVVDPGTKTPNFYGSIADADPDAYITGAEVQVYQDIAGGASVTKWASDQQPIGGTSSRFTLAYAGTALDWGATYRYRSRLWDDMAQPGDWTGWLTFTPAQPIGPATMSPRDTNARQTATPTLSIGHTANFDQYDLEIYATADASGTPLYAPGVVGVGSTMSTTHNVASALPSGATVWWHARIRLTGSGALGDWSPMVPFYVAALPDKPIGLAPGSILVGSPLIIPADTPTLTALYVDVDVVPYGDAPSRREVEVQTIAGAAVVSNTDAAPAYTVPMAWTVTPALTPETSYRVRWRFKDALGVYSPWSDWSYFRVSLPPVVTRVAPI